MEQINLEKQNKTNLLKVCENLGIKNYKKLKKNELIQLINTRTNETKSEELEFDNVIIENESNIEINVENINGLEYLSQINNNSINLILTDPPYIISKDSGMNRHYNNVKDNEENNITEVKTEEEWEEYKIENEIENDDSKDNYIKYDERQDLNRRRNTKGVTQEYLSERGGQGGPKNVAGQGVQGGLCERRSREQLPGFS